MDKKDCKPGSDEAIKLGCTCPVLDNGYGKGYMSVPDVFVREDCPLHGKKKDKNST